ncbi:MAG: hypothetical protein GF401_19750 [Chitinivibrionales bacterium]|nr:hypothetical protein [Chitinivibrionales bacterium]
MSRSEKILLGPSTTAHCSTAEPSGTLLQIDGSDFYAIEHFDRLKPFFISLMSHTNLWMFISSNGSLVCGRVGPDISLFPYETVDKIHQSASHTGPANLLLVTKDGATNLWEPFTELSQLCYSINRTIYKSAQGNSIIFEEENTDLKCTFRYAWKMSDRYGFIYEPSVINNDTSSGISVRLLTGFQNVMPYGVPLIVSEGKSSLADAYKRTELDEETGIGIFGLASNIVDRAEPSEALRASIVWHQGTTPKATLLSPDQIERFRCGDALTTEKELRGQKGAYLIETESKIKPGDTNRIRLVADVAVSQADVVALKKEITTSGNLTKSIDLTVKEGNEELSKLVGIADGLQCSSEQITQIHHFANVLFNIGRGGLFADRYDISKSDLIDFIMVRNKTVVPAHKEFFDSLGESVKQPELLAKAGAQNDPSLARLIYEYLPISFSRRHGDPSRPWNKFSIHLKNPDGSRCLNFEGNWRDIFQNWEALCLSFPSYIPSFIATFVDASTIDGFNPYRITRQGIDWEILNPEDPWSSIGYWGDHQLIYLLKFLEWSERFYPELLHTMLTKEQFSYANVPYDLKPYEDIVADPQDTIAFNDERAAKIDQQVERLGADGKMVLSSDGSVYHVSLLEKMLVSILSKCSNLVLDGGIWMNTLRPEWNDANNALVGNGISMVTLYSLRRYLAFLKSILEEIDIKECTISREVATWFAAINETYKATAAALGKSEVSPQKRREHLDACGKAFTDYRFSVYNNGFSGKTTIALADIHSFLKNTLTCTDHAVRVNKRDDGLYHAYNILHLQPGTAEVEHLYLMLEGQVGVIGSGALTPGEVVDILKAMENSPIYREDQHSYMLYPDRNLPGFLEKNTIPKKLIESSDYLSKQINESFTALVHVDAKGNYRFNPDFKNANDVKKAMNTLPASYAPDNKQRDEVLAIYEKVFNHKAFTGRSGSMFCFEGLGCIYWHQVTKLLLAVEEQFQNACDTNADQSLLKEIKNTYYRVRRGLSSNKDVKEYGSFPADPYSHTPSFAGAQQPGMTGQVKEEIIARWGELGIVVRNGTLQFRPKLLNKGEFLEDKATFRYVNNTGSFQTLQLAPKTFGFTYCGVPIIYSLGANEHVTVIDSKGKSETTHTLELPHEISTKVFSRSPSVERIEVTVNEGMIV